MIKEIRTENYKSIQKLKLNPGRITVLIGENGCGKSNILEAIALSSAASQDKLDNEFLVSRGIRVTEPQFMRAAFDKENIVKSVRISNTFALITEGKTDQIVIENILAGYFKPRDLDENELQPPGDETDRSRGQQFGGWHKVFEYCQSDEFKGAFQVVFLFWRLSFLTV